MLVYYPLAHWVWNQHGWLASDKDGRIPTVDFAGGITIHTSTGVAALAVSLVLQGRVKDTGDVGDHVQGRHNLPIAILGGALIWGGWYSFNGGSAYAANGQAALAVLNTHMSACSSACLWVVLTYWRDERWHLTEIMNGAFAGLAAVTPGSGFMSPGSALVVGVVGGASSYLWCSHVKPRLGIDDALDVCALQVWGSATLPPPELPYAAHTIPFCSSPAGRAGHRGLDSGGLRRLAAVRNKQRAAQRRRMRAALVPVARRGVRHRLDFLLVVDPDAAYADHRRHRHHGGGGGARARRRPDRRAGLRPDAPFAPRSGLGRPHRQVVRRVPHREPDPSQEAVQGRRTARGR